MVITTASSDRLWQLVNVSGKHHAAVILISAKVRKVAIKTLLSQFAKDPQTVGRFMRECGTISELEHPNTIKVYDFGQIEGSQELYVAMEFLSGQSLEQALLAGPLQPERVDEAHLDADDATGEMLQPALKPGQQLVTREGAVWRWDGYTMRAGAPSTAAVRLSQRNRLAELARLYGRTLPPG